MNKDELKQLLKDALEQNRQQETLIENLKKTIEVQTAGHNILLEKLIESESRGNN